MRRLLFACPSEGRQAAWRRGHQNFDLENKRPLVRVLQGKKGLGGGKTRRFQRMSKHLGGYPAGQKILFSGGGAEGLAFIRCSWENHQRAAAEIFQRLFCVMFLQLGKIWDSYLVSSARLLAGQRDLPNNQRTAPPPTPRGGRSLRADGKTRPLADDLQGEPWPLTSIRIIKESMQKYADDLWSIYCKFFEKCHIFQLLWKTKQKKNRRNISFRHQSTPRRKSRAGGVAGPVTGSDVARPTLWPRDSSCWRRAESSGVRRKGEKEAGSLFTCSVIFHFMFRRWKIQRTKKKTKQK